MEPVTYLFETERLGITNADPSSERIVDFNVALRQQDQANRKLGSGASTSPRETIKEFLQMRHDTMYLKYGYGNFVVWLKPTKGGEPQPLGIVSMVREPYAEYPDLGFAFMNSALGKGYATEASKAIMEYCSKNCGVTAFLGFTMSTNDKARKLLERVGLKLQAVVDFEANGTKVDSACYALGEGAEGRTEQYYLDIIRQRLQALLDSGNEELPTETDVATEAAS